MGFGSAPTPSSVLCLDDRCGGGAEDEQGVDELGRIAGPVEGQGLLTSTWRTDDPRPRKYYETTALGAETAERLHTEWLALGAGYDDLRKADA